MPETASDPLTRARASFGSGAWAQAYGELRSAEADAALGAEDLERLGEAARWSRHFGEMIDAFERAAGAYASAGDHRAAARVAVKLAIEHHARRDEALAAGWLGRASRLLEGDSDCREHGLVLWCLAQTRFDEGEASEALRVSDQVIELARRLDDRDLEALGLLIRGHSLLVEGAASEGFALVDEAMAAALGGELELWTTGQVYCSTIFACRNRGDWERAGEWSFASLRWCERNSLSGFPGLCRFHRAEIMRFRGELERAERDAQEAVEELLESAPRFAAWGLHELGEIKRRRGDLAGAAAAFRHSAELGFDPQPGLALLRLDEGKPEVARRAIVAALADSGGMARESRWLVLPTAIEVGIAAGDADLARSSLGELEVLAESLGTEAVRAAATEGRGRVVLADERADEAADHLRTAARAWSEIGVPYEAAHARVALAEAYRALGDADAAGLELEVAQGTFERAGAELAARRVEALRSTAAVPARAARTFMFTDIVDSTRLVEALGDEAWDSLLTWHDRTLRACFEAQDGEEVKHAGDGFFVAFAEPGQAFECACTIQRSLRDHSRDHGFAPRVRIGLHTADATDRGGDYGGRGVHAAARIGAAAGPGEVVASTEALVAAGDRFRGLRERTLELKGLAEPVAVVTVDWSDA